VSEVNRKSEASSREEDISIYNVPAVDRAARILFMLGQTGTQQMTLAEITQATGWHKSSVHKILVTLCHHGFLERYEDSKRYSLGIALVRCGQSVLNNLQIRNSVKPALKELSEYSGETANVAVLRGTKMVIVDAIEATVDLRVSPPIGTVDPATTKSNGKAVLAYLPENQVNKILQLEGLPAHTPQSITSVKLFLNELAAIREKGYAIDSEEFQAGISAVSAPLFDSQASPVGTLSIVGPALRLTKEKLELYGRKCAQIAAQASPVVR
jgi:DNA-binding IclR family transcriptional regulator